MVQASGISQEQTPLPDGYHYANLGSVQPIERAELLTSVGVYRDPAILERLAERMTSRGIQTLGVGIRNNDDHLIGYGTVLHFGEDVGELSDLAVHPDHQGRGVGKANLEERMRLAQQIGITSLFIPKLMPTNRISKHYLKLSFVEDVDGNLLWGENPRRIIDWVQILTSK